MRLVDAFLFRLEDATRSLLRALWGRFLGFTLIGKGFAIALGTFIVAWSAAQIGLDGLARQLAEVAWFIVSLVLTAVVIRHIWLRFTNRSHYPTWYQPDLRSLPRLGAAL